MGKRFDRVKFISRLKRVTIRPEAIQQTAKNFFLFNKCADECIDCWQNVFNQASPSFKLVLIYLCNEVIQTCKREEAEHFKDLWLPVIRECFITIQNTDIVVKVQRVVEIWLQRGIYLEEQINNLNVALDPNYGSNQSLENDNKEINFDEILNQLNDAVFLESGITECLLLIDVANDLHLFLNEPNLCMQKIKDKEHCTILKERIGIEVERLQEIFTKISQYTSQRKHLINLLSSAEFFLNSQMNEVIIITDAYKDYLKRIAAVFQKLNEINPSLPEISDSDEFDTFKKNNQKFDNINEDGEEIYDPNQPILFDSVDDEPDKKFLSGRRRCRGIDESPSSPSSDSSLSPPQNKYFSDESDLTFISPSHESKISAKTPFSSPPIDKFHLMDIQRFNSFGNHSMSPDTHISSHSSSAQKSNLFPRSNGRSEEYSTPLFGAPLKFNERLSGEIRPSSKSKFNNSQ